MDELIKKLQEKLPDEAIQRTKGAETRKGYDTSGFGYQYAVNRFNETLGSAWGYKWSVLRECEGAFKSGQKFHDVTVAVSIWVENKDNERACCGGHISALYVDALKGAITNAFKKTAAFWGVGRHAYEGSIDDDNTPMPDSLDNVIEPNKIIHQESMYDNPNENKCKKCGSPLVVSKSTGKMYCADKCWLKESQTKSNKQSGPQEDIPF
jgi:hypothetical protein